MEMHAYSEDYLLTAQRILGDMLDYAVNEYEFDPDEFYKMFLVSDVSRQFQEGNPTYKAGKNGCIWTNHQNIGLAGHWRTINGIQQDRL